jgi:hypothetical protein
MFAKEAKRIADNTMDDFIHTHEQIFISDPLRRIKEDAVLMAFTDAQTGYRRQMNEWIKANPIKIKKQTISADNMPDDIPLIERESFKRTMSTLGVGTIVVIGLHIVTGAKWIWLAELATFAASGKAYFSGKKIDEIKRAEMQQKWVESCKKQIVISIKRDLGIWFDNAEKENTRILESFNII